MTRSSAATALKPTIATQESALPIRARDASAYGCGLDDHGEIDTGYGYPVPSTVPHAQSKQPMYQFGEHGIDPANYSQSSALLSALHFTAMNSPQVDDGFIEDLFSANVAEELASCGLYDACPESFADQRFVEAYAEDPVAPIDQRLWFPPVWPRQQLMKDVTTDYALNQTFVVDQRACTSPVKTSYSTNTQPGQLKNASVSQRYRRPLAPAPKDRNFHAAPPDAIQGDERPAVRGRKRALSPEARLSARRVRMKGACARCHAKKEKCDYERPCGPCQSKSKRSLDFPCSPELPSMCHVHLFTKHMYNHLSLKDGDFFCESRMPRSDPDPRNKPFWIRLDQYFDKPQLRIPVVRFKPRHTNDINKSVFPIEINERGYEVQHVEILSPPLIPAMNNSNIIKYVQEFRGWVNSWLEHAENHEDIEWHQTFFREEHGKAFPRAVLADVCKFYHQVTMRGCPALKSSLQSTVLAYMLGHSFYIPEEDIGPLLDRTELGHKWNGEFMFVSPIHVDRFLKALLFQFFKGAVRTAFTRYEALCSPNKHSALYRDRILATSITMLIVTGSQQSKAIEKALARERRHQEVDEEKVYEQICEIEEWINDMIIRLWTYKAKYAKDVDEEARHRCMAHQAKIFSLKERFKTSYENFASGSQELKELETKLPSANDINVRTFGANNIDRLLKKLYMAVFPPADLKSSLSGEGQQLETPPMMRFAIPDTMFVPPDQNVDRAPALGRAHVQC